LMLALVGGALGQLTLDDVELLYEGQPLLRLAGLGGLPLRLDGVMELASHVGPAATTHDLRTLAQRRVIGLIAIGLQVAAEFLQQLRRNRLATPRGVVEEYDWVLRRSGTLHPHVGLGARRPSLFAQDLNDRLIHLDEGARAQRLAQEIHQRQQQGGEGDHPPRLGHPRERDAEAGKLEKIVTTIFNPPAAKNRRGPVEPATLQVVADERTNSVVLLASENDTLKVKKLITLLDKDVPKGKEKIHIYYLENADAEELAKVLQALPAKEEAPKPGQPVIRKMQPSVTESVTITPDKATNSLIIRGDADDYKALEEIIRKLDIPRSMVYIECLIMEVDVNKEFELGTEWSAFGGDLRDDGTFRGGGGGFGGGGFNKIPSIDPETGLPTRSFPPGFSLGIFETIKIGNIYFPNLASIVTAYKKDKDVHILSTPQVLTTDNQEAKITVGKNIPYQTKEGRTDSEESFSTFEYKDVGISLKITPSISKDRLVRMTLSQEFSQLESTTDFRPTTLKRTLDTTVIVHDANTVVIGGLIGDSFTKTEYRVPCLGDIPVAGWLFRSMAKGGEKTNLFVFLTPHVINNPTEARRIYEQKKEAFDRVREEDADRRKTGN